MRQAWLLSSVSRGQFPNEYAVSGQQYNGAPYSLFAPKERVRAPEGGDGEGQILVEIVQEKSDMVLVRLPAQTFENGQYVTVFADQLCQEPSAKETAV